MRRRENANSTLPRAVACAGVAATSKRNRVMRTFLYVLDLAA